MTIGYTAAQPGSWRLLTTGDTVLYTDGTASAAVDELWLALGSATPVQSALGVLTRSGLADAPSFALAHIVEGSLHALVRGPLALAVTTAAGSESVNGTGVSTWNETTVAGVTALQLGDSTGHLPMGSGVVWASGFTLQTQAAAITTPVSAPPVVAPPAPQNDLPAEHTMVEHTLVDEVPEPLGEHDGETVMIADLAEMRARRAEAAPEESGEHDGETVMSADIAALRARNRPVAEAPAPPPAPHTIYLELPSDQREPLTQPVIIGRSPSVSQVSGAELPRLVSIPGNQDISRSHARFALEGDTVVVTDLHSRNGTTIALPGKPPLLLRKGEPTAVLPGTVVNLGGVVSLTVRQP